jgi:hypothetical protein
MLQALAARKDGGNHFRQLVQRSPARRVSDRYTSGLDFLADDPTISQPVQRFPASH